MKILIITGSHRIKQTSYGMAVKLSRKLRQKQDAVVDILELAELKINNCCATAKCSKTLEKRCLYEDDDFNSIFEKMIDNDAIFFIVPKYAPYPSRFMALLERIVAISWWGYAEKNEIANFVLYKKPVGVISFANSPVTQKETFNSLFDSFESIGFDLLDFNNEGHGLFINRGRDNEDQLLQRVCEVFSSKIQTLLNLNY